MWQATQVVILNTALAELSTLCWGWVGWEGGGGGAESMSRTLCNSTMSTHNAHRVKRSWVNTDHVIDELHVGAEGRYYSPRPLTEYLAIRFKTGTEGESLKLLSSWPEYEQIQKEIEYLSFNMVCDQTLPRWTNREEGLARPGKNFACWKYPSKT